MANEKIFKEEMQTIKETEYRNRLFPFSEGKTLRNICKQKTNERKIVKSTFKARRRTTLFAVKM